MRSRRVLFIGLGLEQLDFASALKKAGHSIIALSRLPAEQLTELADEIRNVDPLDIRTVLAVAREVGVDAVVSDQCDYSRYAEETVAHALGLSPLPTATAVGVSKILQRQLAAGCVPQPSYTICHNVGAALAAFEALGGDVVLKPSDARGGFGVSRVRNKAEVEMAYYRARENGVVAPVLVEAFVPGELITFDGVMSDDGFELKAVSRSIHTVSESVRLEQHIYVSPNDAKELTALGEPLTQEVCRAMGFCHGFIHSEWMYGDNQLTFIEIANRAPGIRAVSRMMSVVCGEDLYARVYPDLLPPSPQVRRRRYCVQRFFFGRPGQRGRSFLRGDLQGHPLLLDYEIWPVTAPPQPNGLVRLGYATFGGDDLEELLHVMDGCRSYPESNES